MIECPAEIDKLNKWTIPNISTREIYNIGMLDFKLVIAIKTMKKTTHVD